MHTNKQSVGEMLNEKTVKTTIRRFYHKGFIDNSDNADEVVKRYLISEKRRPDSDQKQQY